MYVFPAPMLFKNREKHTLNQENQYINLKIFIFFPSGKIVTIEKCKRITFFSSPSFSSWQSGMSVPFQSKLTSVWTETVSWLTWEVDNWHGSSLQQSGQESWSSFFSSSQLGSGIPMSQDHSHQETLPMLV